MKFHFCKKKKKGKSFSLSLAGSDIRWLTALLMGALVCLWILKSWYFVLSPVSTSLLFILVFGSHKNSSSHPSFPSCLLLTSRRQITTIPATTPSAGQVLNLLVVREGYYTDPHNPACLIQFVFSTTNPDKHKQYAKVSKAEVGELQSVVRIFLFFNPPQKPFTQGYINIVVGTHCTLLLHVWLLESRKSNYQRVVVGIPWACYVQSCITFTSCSCSTCLQAVRGQDLNLTNKLSVAQEHCMAASPIHVCTCNLHSPYKNFTIHLVHSSMFYFHDVQ